MSSDPNLWGPGAQLIPGPPGPMGPVGPAPELSIGNVTPGVAPAVSITPSGEGAYILNFVLQTGATGLRGLPGEAAKFSEVNVDTLPAGSPATATITGQGPEYVLNLGIPQGATGETGDVGPDGRATAIGYGSEPPEPEMGIEGDYYIQTEPTVRLVGPKPADDTWAGAPEVPLQGPRGRDAENLRLSIGTVQEAPSPSVVLTGSFPDYVLNFDLVKGDRGDDGQVVEVVAGTHIDVDDTDPSAPVVSFTGTLGGQVDSIVAGDGISVDDTDPENPIVSFTGGAGGGQVDSLTAGTGISVDNLTDPTSPEVSLSQAVQDELAKIPGIEQAIGDIGEALDIINGEVVP